MKRLTWLALIVLAAVAWTTAHVRSGVQLTVSDTSVQASPLTPVPVRHTQTEPRELVVASREEGAATRADSVQSAVKKPMHPLWAQERLQAEARTIDLARSVLEDRDLIQAKRLLRQVEAEGDQLMVQADREALRLATECLLDDSAHTRGAALSFLRTVPSALLRKHVRKLCFPTGS